MGALVDFDRLPMNVFGAAEREMNQARADGAIGQAIDQDETAGVAVLNVGIKGNWLVEAQVADADLVELQRFRRQLFQGVDVDLVLDVGDGRQGELRADLDPVLSAGQHRLLGHPDDRHLELVGHARQRIDAGQHIAAADVDLVFQHDGDGLFRDCLLQIAIDGHNACNLALLAGGKHP